MYRIFHKIGKASGVNTLKIRGAKNVHKEGKTPLRLDNFGKRCRVPFFNSLAPPELVSSIQNI